jgi:hypothetical protein
MAFPAGGAPDPRAGYWERPASGCRCAARVLTIALLGVRLPAADVSDLWVFTLEEAREAAAFDGKHILVLFPSPRPADLPPSVVDGTAVRRAGEKLHLARIRATDLEEALQLFAPKKFPALVLLDGAGGAAERWEGTFPPDLWSLVERADKRVRSIEEDLSRALAEGRNALARKDWIAALAAVRKVRTFASPDHPQVLAAAAVEESVLRSASEGLSEVLGGDGILPDAQLLMALGRLRSLFPHPAFLSLVDREVARVRGLAVSGKREG